MDKNVSVEAMKEYQNLIDEASKYQSPIIVWIVLGLEKVGLSNARFWLNFVAYLNNEGRIDDVINYYILMTKIEPEDLIKYLENIKNNKNFKTDEKCFLEFGDLLNRVTGTKMSR